MADRDEKRLIIEASRFTGVNVIDDPITLDPSESPYCINMDITRAGQMITRYGYEKVCELEGTGGMAGLLPYYRTYDANSGDYLVFFFGGNAYYITNEDTTPVLIGSYGSELLTVRGTTYNNVLVFGNSHPSNVVQQFDGTSITPVPNNPPNGRIFGVYMNTLFIAGVDAAPYNVYYLNPDTQDSYSFLPIDIGDGQNVTALVGGQDKMTTFKDDSIHGINRQEIANFNLTIPQVMNMLSSKGGAYVTGSVQPVYGYMYFLAKNGFQTYGPSAESINANIPLPLSLKITPLIEQINFAYRDKASSAFFENEYKCAISVGPGGRENNYVFVYNESVKRRFQVDNFVVYKDIPIDQFAVFRNADGKDELYFSSNSAPIIYKFNKSFDDDGLGYERVWRSKTFQYGEKTTWEYLDLYGTKVLGGRIFLRVWADGTVVEDIEINDDNFQNGSNVDGLIGSNYIGNAYIGSGYYSDVASPMYKWKYRYYFAPQVRESYNMYFELYNTGAGEGWSLSKYKLVSIPLPDDPTYPYAN